MVRAVTFFAAAAALAALSGCHVAQARSLQQEPKPEAPAAVPPVELETFEGKGIFAVENAACKGKGEFSGEGTFKGAGSLMSLAGTFAGNGTYLMEGGTFTAEAGRKWTCEGSGTFVFDSDAQVKFSGNGTVSGDGSFATPSGSFVGDGMYEGINVVFTSKLAEQAGNFTIDDLLQTAQANSVAEPKSIKILGSGIASVVGPGTFQGEGTCRGEGALSGSGTLSGEGTLMGKGTLDGEGSLEGSGTFEGEGNCAGVSVRFYET